MSSAQYPAERPIFPFYLLPSLPFPRRRTAQAKTTASAAAGADTATPILSTPPWPASPLSSTASTSASHTPSSSSTTTSSLPYDLPSTSHQEISGALPLPPQHSPTYTDLFSDLHLHRILSTPSTAQTTPGTSPPTTTTTGRTTPSSSPPSASSLSPTKHLSPSTTHTHAGTPSTPPRTKLQSQPPTLRCSTCSTDIAFTSQIISKGFTGRHGRAYLLSPLPPLPSLPSASNCATTASPAIPQRGFGISLLDPFGSFSSSAPSHAGGDGGEGEEGKGRGEKYDLLNVVTHEPARRQLVTGLHVVADISCKVCERVVGWKYVDAREEGQRYKIGKFIVETRRVVGGGGWEDWVGGEEGEEGEIRKEKGEGKGWDANGDVEFDSSDEEECEEIFAGVWDSEVVGRRRGKKVAAKKGGHAA